MFDEKMREYLSNLKTEIDTIGDDSREPVTQESVSTALRAVYCTLDFFARIHK